MANTDGSTLGDKGICLFKEATVVPFRAAGQPRVADKDGDPNKAGFAGKRKGWNPGRFLQKR